VSSTAVPAILDPAEISRLIDERAMSWLQRLGDRGGRHVSDDPDGACT